MIIEIPTAADFASTSLNQWHLARGIIVSSIGSYRDSAVIHRHDTEQYVIVGIDGTKLSHCLS
jgi:hypothetical protein